MVKIPAKSRRITSKVRKLTKIMKILAKAEAFHQKYKNSRKNVENLNKMGRIPSKVWKLKKILTKIPAKKAGVFHLKYENSKKILTKIPAKAGEFHQKYETSRKNAENFNKMGRISAEGYTGEFEA
jgi:hypothetical protein